MPEASPNQEARWGDLILALEFAEKHVERWQKEGRLSQKQADGIRLLYAQRREIWRKSRDEGKPAPEGTGLPPAELEEHPARGASRRWRFLERELERFAQVGILPLALSHDLQTEARERRMAVERRLEAEQAPEVLPVEPERPAARTPASAVRAARPRRNLMEILLDPRNIQLLLGLGGALMVVGLVIWLWHNNYFTPPVVAVSLGAVNAALLAAGWWVIRSSRYQLAGKALTLLACLVMPLNLWYYHANGLVTIGGHLWAAALVISVLYAASARILRDELFVYVLAGGVALTGLLILAELPPSPQRFWEIASPATLLVALGLAFIHAERAFPEQEGPFSRRRFGLAFFWSGHALLGAGLLLVLGADIAGDWLYQPFFKSVYAHWHGQPSPIVNELRLLALALVLAGTYAYLYSDIVVRRVGAYVYVAAVTLLWAQVLLLEQFFPSMEVSAWIAVLALTALALQLFHAMVLRDSTYARALPVLGVILGIAAVLLGLVHCLRAISSDLRSIWSAEPPSWYFVGAMMLTAVACRVAAFISRKKAPVLTAISFFSTAAAIMIGATALLAAINLVRWEQHAPLLMVIPIAYLGASYVYRGRPEEQPLVWIAHAATVVLLIGSVASALEGFTRLVENQPINLSLALFFLEAGVFYGLAGALRKQVAAIHLSAAMACAALWQLLTYWGMPGEYYTLTFALVGLGLLIAYRLAVLERFAANRLAYASFHCANTLLSLSFIAAALIGLSRLATHGVHWSFAGLCVLLILISLLAVALVREPNWRRWYLVTSIGLGLLTFLVIQMLSTLTPWQKLEIFCVAVGLLLLVVGHVGWYREQDRQSDMVSLSLLLGSLLAGIPLVVATYIDRSRDYFIFLNEVGFLALSLLLLTTGFLFQLRSTALTGAALTVLYFLGLLIFIPWSRLNTVAVSIIVGGGVLFATGLVLSLYRDRLMALPDKIKRRQGVFRILSWR
jgi:hypothetical protein